MLETSKVKDPRPGRGYFTWVLLIKEYSIYSDQIYEVTTNEYPIPKKTQLRGLLGWITVTLSNEMPLILVIPLLFLRKLLECILNVKLCHLIAYDD